jgi:DNA-directed RNA polymerase subunit L
MYIDYTNNTNEIVTVGTDDCKFYLAEKQIETPYKKNIQIIDLQPKQNFKASVITQLGAEHISSIYTPVSIFTYKMVAEDKYIVSLESRGKLDEKTILHYAFENIRKILNDFLGMIPDKEDISGKLQLNNSDHTIGNIISDGLREHKLVKFGGYNSPHLLDNKIIFHYELTEKANIKHIMTEIVSKYVDIFNTINKHVIKNID